LSRARSLAFARRMASGMLGLTPALDLGRPCGDGVAALLLLPLLRAARLLTAVPAPDGVG